MEDEVFEVDELAVDPEGGAGVGEILAFKEASADDRAGDAFVQTCQRCTGVESRASSRS